MVTGSGTAPTYLADKKDGKMNKGIFDIHVIDVYFTSASGRLKEICPRGNNKVLIYISLYHDKCLLFMLDLYYSET